MCFIRKSKQTVNSPQKIPSMAYYHAIFTLSFILLYLFYFLFLPRIPGNSLLVEVSQYWKKKKKMATLLLPLTMAGTYGRRASGKYVAGSCGRMGSTGLNSILKVYLILTSGKWSFRRWRPIWVSRSYNSHITITIQSRKVVF